VLEDMSTASPKKSGRRPVPTKKKDEEVPPLPQIVLPPKGYFASCPSLAHAACVA
jgi:hypothetical protein